VFAGILVVAVVGAAAIWMAWKAHERTVQDHAAQAQLIAQGGHRVQCQHQITTACAQKAAVSLGVPVAWLQSVHGLRAGKLLVRSGIATYPA
jgi:hypothetical protein